MSIDLGSAHGKIDIDASGAKAGSNEASIALASLGKQAAGISKTLESVGGNLKKTGKTLSTYVTAPIVGVGIAVAKMSIDFDREMRNVSSISDYTRQHFDEIKQSVIDLSTKVPQSASVLAKGLYEIASSGYDGKDAMLILEASARAAAAGLTDTNTAADAATTVLNAYGMKATEVGRMQDIMFQAVKLGKLTYEQLAGSLSTVASTAAAAKVPFEQVAGAYATMTKAGITADEAATALNQVLLSYISPAKEAKDAAKALGIDLSATALSTKGLSGVMAELASKVGISEAELDKITKSGKSDAEIQAELARRAGITTEQFGALFGNVRALKGVLSLTRQEGKVFASDTQAMYQSTGAAADAFGEQSKATGFKMQQSLNQLSAAGLKFGDSMAPAIEKVAAGIGKLANWLSKLSPAQREMILKFGLALAVIGPLLMGLGSLISTAGVVAGAVSAMAAAVGIGVAPFLLIVGAIAAVVAAGIYLYTHWDQVKAKLAKLWGDIKTAAVAAFNAVVKTISEFPGRAATFLSQLPGKVAYWIGYAMGTLVRLIAEGLPRAYNYFMSLPGRIAGYISSIVPRIFSAAGGVLHAMYEMGRNATNNAVSFFVGLPGRIIHFISGLPGRLFSLAHDIASNFWRGFKKGLGISSPSLVEKAFMAIGDQAIATVDTVSAANTKLGGIASKMPRVAATSASMSNPSMTRTLVNTAISGSMHVSFNFPGNITVRSDNDIQKLSQSLAHQAISALRGKGVVSMAGV